MLIELSKLLQKYKVRPTGVLHLGAHIGEEAVKYHMCGIGNVIWVEGNPEIHKRLVENVAKYRNHKAFNFLIGNEDGKEVDFRVTNNGESSSILELDLHLKHHPHIHVIDTMHLKTKTIDTFMAENNFDMKDYNFMNIDLQGAELMALQGTVANLHKVDYIYTEINSNTLYKDCPLIADLDNFLVPLGFERVETSMTEYEWGDAFYVRKK